MIKCHVSCRYPAFTTQKIYSKRKDRLVIGSHLMIGLKGESLTRQETIFLIQEQIAGVILFKRNLIGFQQIHELCSELKSLPLQQPLLLGIDMEGGLVNRLSHVEGSLPWPSAFALSQKTEKEIFQMAQILAQRLSALGFDINFAPVVDLPITDSSVLKTRTFGSDNKSILTRAGAFTKGLVEGGLTPCLKHFPGHGGVSEDSHKVLPKDLRSLKELESQIQIFEQLSQQACIMTCHIEFPNVDKTPASFSKVFLQTELRRRRGFSGVIVSDDIDMLALEMFSPGQRVYKSLQAGCDLVLSCQKESSYQQAIDFFKDKSLPATMLSSLKQSARRLSILTTDKKIKKWHQVKKILDSSNHTQTFRSLGFIT